MAWGRKTLAPPPPQLLTWPNSEDENKEEDQGHAAIGHRGVFTLRSGGGSREVGKVCERFLG